MAEPGPGRIDQVPTIPPRNPDAHKGTFGTVLVVAGSRGMSGAAALAALGALRSGAGRVRVAVPAGIQAIVAGFHPCYMTLGLVEDKGGHLADAENRAVIEDAEDQSQAVVIGPGLGRTEGVRSFVRWLLRRGGPPVVVDADALTLIGPDPSAFRNLGRDAIVTPHPGEMAALLGTNARAVQGDRIGSARRLVEGADRLVAVLKGSRTIVADRARVFENETGNPGMATGGTGDVLAGAIGALLAQGYGPFEAAVLGAHAHGSAGDLARDRRGEIGMTALDLVECLPEAFRSLQSR